MKRTSPETPVLFTVFNRPACTRRVFEAIRRAAPRRLFIACDGPRPERPEEAPLVSQVRGIVAEVDWECEVATLFRKENLGCRNAMSSAISWFFSEVEEGIILEDDCLPDPTFFRYCRELLERYRDDERVMNISGVNSLLRGAELGDSYYFSRYPHIWGWASWRRAWRNYSPDMPDYPDFVQSGALADCFPDPVERKRWREILDKVYRGEPGFNTWDAQWSYAHFKNNALAVTPRNNLVENIGCTPDAMHTAGNPFAELPAVQAEFPLRHPQFPIRNTELDRQTFRHDYANPLWKRIRRRLVNMRRH